MILTYGHLGKFKVIKKKCIICVWSIPHRGTVKVHTSYKNTCSFWTDGVLILNQGQFGNSKVAGRKKVKICVCSVTFFLRYIGQSYFIKYVYDLRMSWFRPKVIGLRLMYLEENVHIFCLLNTFPLEKHLTFLLVNRSKIA